jgi:hypothetical protein
MSRTPVTPAADSQFSIVDDLADGIEAVHQCANLAGFSERPRALIFALASAARSRHNEAIELYDEELADLQNCSTKTVQRQRADYLGESRQKKFDLVEIIEGTYDKTRNRNEPTLYRFHLGNIVERIVLEARASKHWHESDRRKQRDAIKRAAELVYEDIPEAPPRRRKKKRARLATAEIQTCQKIIKTKFDSLKDIASKLPPNVREQLLNAEDPGELIQWWLELRAEMDDFFNVDSSQGDDEKEDSKGGGQVVHPDETVKTVIYGKSRITTGPGLFEILIADDPDELKRVPAFAQAFREMEATPELPDDSPEPTPEPAEDVLVQDNKDTRTHSPEEIEVWNRIEERLNQPAIRRVDVQLCASDLPPETTGPPDGKELAERAAVGGAESLSKQGSGEPSG